MGGGVKWKKVAVNEIDAGAGEKKQLFYILFRVCFSRFVNFSRVK